MSEHWEIYADWNPWHGCTKISPGCKFCYVYRIDRFMECVPDDWGDGYDNVIVGCTVENQAMADKELNSDLSTYHTKPIPGCYQLSQAHKANIDYMIGRYLVPETVRYEWKESDYHE